AGGVKHRDASVTVTDQTRLMQGACRRCHPGPPDRQHHRKKFLSERQLIGADPVASQQQPTGKALLKAVRAVAGGGLRDLLVEAMRISGKIAAQHLVCIERVSERLRWHAQSRSLELNHRL